MRPSTGSAFVWAPAHEMMDVEAQAKQKWRPTLGLVVVLMLLFVLALPLGGIWLFRFYDTQLVRETENELISQAAFVKAIMRAELQISGFDPEILPQAIVKNAALEADTGRPEASLDLSTTRILPTRTDAIPVETRARPEFLLIGERIGQINREVQQTTLAGFRLLDFNGIVIAGRDEKYMSLAHVPEVSEALEGRYASRVRQRISDSPRPPIYSISRGTDIRVFVAMPIDYQGKVAGVIYMSRTPSHFLRELYGQRWNLAGAAVFMLLITGTIAVLFVRTIKGPIDTLNDRTRRLSEGDRTAIKPLHRHGTREIAELSNGIFLMSRKLFDRSDYIRNFATHVSHELKSPLTSIHGAAELLMDEGEAVSPERRQQFLANIIKDTDRMSTLLNRLRELAATESRVEGTTSTLSNVIERQAAKHDILKFDILVPDDLRTAIPDESLSIILGNLADNSSKHGASNIRIEAHLSANGMIELLFSDDGEGISLANRDKVLEMFFTTRRETGGTGMGLNIIQSVLRVHGGSISVGNADDAGALFRIFMPAYLAT
ncbi:MAG: ATP-binding protein [Pseudomonadota bacterium]